MRKIKENELTFVEELKDEDLAFRNDEIIRGEADQFYRFKIRRPESRLASDTFRLVKLKLSDYYELEHKALFLDSLLRIVVSNLQEHRDRAHDGKPSLTCDEDLFGERLLFYIRQEIRTLPLIAHQKYEENPTNKRSKVFISYSHKDKDILGEVQRHFMPLRAKIDLWDDERIDGGQKWKTEIKKAISETKVAILLVSTDFLGSEFIASEELPPLLEAAEKEGAVILPIILDDCLFDQFEELNQYQALNPPSNPLNQMNTFEMDRLFVNMVRQSKRILDNEATT